MGVAHVVSATVGLICLVVAGLLWFVVGVGGGKGGGGGKGFRRHLPRVVILLVATGVTGLLGTRLGVLLHETAGWLDKTTGKFIGVWTGVAIVGLVGLVTVVVVIVHLQHGKASVSSVVAAALAPVAVVTIPGTMGQMFSSGMSAVTGVVGWGVGAMFGLG